MPSFPDLSHEHDHDTDLTVSHAGRSTAPEDVLRRIKVEGLRRRHRRHRRNALVAALGLVAVAVPAIALLPSDDDEDRVTVAAAPDDTADTGDAQPTVRPDSGSTTIPPGQTTVTQDPTLPSTTVVQDEADAPVATAPPPPAPSPTVTTIPAPTCRNSTDPACGPFRWDPAPGANEPLTAAFVDVPSTVTAGEAVTFFVAWSDPDAQLTFDHFSPDGVGLASGCAFERRYGPWTPPDPVAGSGELSYTHTFAAPGEYLVAVSLATGTCGEPYASERTVELTVTVV